jgi:hypothetical protein
MSDSGELFGETHAELAKLRTLLAASEELVSQFRQELSSNNQHVSALALEREQLKAELDGARTEAERLRAIAATSANLVPQLRIQTAQILRRAVNIGNASREKLEHELSSLELNT